MVAFGQHRTFWIAGSLPIVAAVLCSGCQQDEIRSYTVPRIDVPKEEARMLAAIVPHGEQSWYFKMIGPPDQIKEHQQEFRPFVESTQFGSGPHGHVDWKSVPETWRRETLLRPGDLHYAAFRVGPDEARVRVTVTPLGNESTVLDNINRWRGQLSLPPVSQADLPKLVQKMKVGETVAKMVDFTGTLSPGGAPMAPFAKAGMESRTNAGVTLPFSYTLPSGWKEAVLAPMSLATFRVEDGNRAAALTVTPLEGKGGGLLVNVRRWRQQVGLAPADDEQLRKEIHKIQVAGMNGDFVELVGPESVNGPLETILGVVFEHGPQTWFIKFKGDAQLVAKEKPNFEAFVRSMRITATGAK
jgi:hypothetical protein